MGTFEASKLAGQVCIFLISVIQTEAAKKLLSL